MARLKRGRGRYLGQNVGPQHEEHQEQAKDHAHVEGGVETDLTAFGQRDERFTDDQDDPQVRPFNHVFGVIQRQHTAMMLDIVAVRRKGWRRRLILTSYANTGSRIIMTEKDKERYKCRTWPSREKQVK